MNCIYCGKLNRKVSLTKDRDYFYCKTCRSNQLIDNGQLFAYDFIFNYNSIIYKYKAFPLVNKSSLHCKDEDIYFEKLLNINPNNCASKIRLILSFL